MTGFLQFDPGNAQWDAPGSVAECRPGDCDSKLSSKMAENSPVRVVTEPAVASVATVAGWRASIESMRDFARPDFIGRHEWQVLLYDATSVASMWADQAFGLGWTIEDIFGCPPKPWLRRLDPCGLVYLMNGNRVGAVSENEIGIIQRDGRSLQFRRQDPAMNVPFDRSAAIPIWRAFSPEHLSCR